MVVLGTMLTTQHSTLTALSDPLSFMDQVRSLSETKIFQLANKCVEQAAHDFDVGPVMLADQFHSDYPTLIGNMMR